MGIKTATDTSRELLLAHFGVTYAEENHRPGDRAISDHERLQFEAFLAQLHPDLAFAERMGTAGVRLEDGKIICGVVAVNHLAETHPDLDPTADACALVHHFVVPSFSNQLPVGLAWGIGTAEGMAWQLIAHHPDLFSAWCAWRSFSSPAAEAVRRAFVNLDPVFEQGEGVWAIYPRTRAATHWLGPVELREVLSRDIQSMRSHAPANRF